MDNHISSAPRRHSGFDLLRVLATYMVMQIHTGEFEYIGSNGTVLHSTGAWAAGWMNSLLRVCVPLFVMISGFFLFPIKDEKEFFRKRFTRVLIPFVLWCAIYAFYYYARGMASFSATLLNIAKIPVNYGTEVGHLWFIYMLIGIYLIGPVLSPWIVSANRRGMEFFLLLWGLTLLLPYIHLYFPQVWGEAYWNATPTLYYFSGFIGYVVLAVYIRRFHMRPSPYLDCLAFGMVLVGYAVTAGGFLLQLPVEHNVSAIELTWNFTTLNVALMTAGIFLLFRNLQPERGNSLPWRLTADISRKSYGIYLAHIILLNAMHTALAARIPNAFLRLPTIALATFVTTYLAIKILSLLPKSKFLIG